MKGPRIWFVITRVRYTDKICKEFVRQFVIPRFVASGNRYIGIPLYCKNLKQEF